MKILIAASGFDSPRKHEVNIFALDQAKALRGYYRYTLDGIPVYYASVPCGALPLGLPESAGRLAVSGIRRAVGKDGWTPDIIHQHFGFELAAMAEREGVPFIFTEHSSHHNRTLSPKQAERLKKEYGRCSAVLAVSRALAKNMAGLLRAFAALHGEPRLIIFGDGPESGALRTLCAELGLYSRVSFRGHCPREELAEAYAAADCFVLASRSETFGVAYIEAMAAGLPVIATRCGGPEDFVTEENGILIPVDDESALIDAMERISAENLPPRPSPRGLPSFMREFFHADFVYHLCGY